MKSLNIANSQSNVDNEIPNRNKIKTGGDYKDMSDPGDAVASHAVTLDIVPIDFNGKEKAHHVEESSKKENIFLRYYRKKTKGLTKTQISIFLIFPFVEFFAATVISLQGPFYPQVAESKGATSTEHGLVFGVFEIVVFIMAPIYGAKMGVWNPHRLFNWGIFTTSLSCFVFGFMHYIPDRTAFIMVSIVIRIIEAIGDAAFVTASFSIIAAEFPDAVATTFAMMETFYGFGMIAGPTVGGFLYEFGGFTLPFAVMGACLFVSAIATYFCITKKSTPDSDKIVSSSSFEMFKMLKIPAILLTAYGTFAAASGIGFLQANVAKHVAQFGLRESRIGIIFMLNGGVYALSAPFWGKLCEKSSQPKIFSLIGAFLTIIGFVLVGPLPIIPNWTPSIPVICAGLVIFGLGLGSTLVSAFILFLQDAIAVGRPDNVSTHGLVSGLWTSMTAFGFFIGTTSGGFLYDVVGFEWGTLFILLQQFVLVGLLTHFFIRSSAMSDKKTKIDKKLELEDVVTKSEKEDVSKSKDDTENSQPPTTKMNGENLSKMGKDNPNFIADP